MHTIDFGRRRLEQAAPTWQAASSRLRRLVDPQMAFADGDEHRRIRDVVQRSFTPKVVRGMTQQVRDMVRELLGQSDEALDVIPSVAYPLPARVICTMLGVPEDDHPALIEWAKVIIDFVGRTSVEDAYLESAQAQLTQWADYCGDLAQTQSSGSSVLADMYAAHQDQRISWDELLANAMFLLSAGHETTTSLIGNGLLALLRFPDQLELLRHNPELIPPAVEELLRYDSPVQVTFRTTVAPVHIADHDIPEGEELSLVIGAANRDPNAYPDPHQVDITRQGPGHLAFATGPHVCLGSTLARMEAQQVFSVLTQEFATIALDGDAKYGPNPVFRRLDCLPVRISRP